jgi:hypothetical protein
MMLMLDGIEAAVESFLLHQAQLLMLETSLWPTSLFAPYKHYNATPASMYLLWPKG